MDTDLYLIQKQQFEVNDDLMMNLLQTHNFWVTYIRLLVDYSDVLSAVLAAPIHCRGSIGEQVMNCRISPHLFI